MEHASVKAPETQTHLRSWHQSCPGRILSDTRSCSCPACSDTVLWLRTERAELCTRYCLQNTSGCL